ncbi:hypothetical protein PCE1_003410 [Barthelona sp. PCE]
MQLRPNLQVTISVDTEHFDHAVSKVLVYEKLGNEEEQLLETYDSEDNRILSEDNGLVTYESFTASYTFEVKQHLKVEIYSNSKDIEDTVTFTPVEALKSTGNFKRKWLVVNIEEEKVCMDILHLDMKLNDFTPPPLGCCRSSVTLHLVASCKTPGEDTYTTSYRSHHFSTRDVGEDDILKLAPMDISISSLCNGDIEREIQWTIRSTRGIVYSTVYASVSKLLEERIMRFEGTSTSTIEWNGSIEKKHSFLEYVQAGTEIQFMCSIDCTKSNIVHYQKDSLHFSDEKTESPYLKALKAIGSILEPYDSDQMIPAFLFGAMCPSGRVEHCFPISLVHDIEELHGIETVGDHLRRALDLVEMSGPTCFSPTINHAIERVNTELENDKVVYHIVLILTDGEPTDFTQTINAINAAAKLPISIIICGLGNNNFDKLHILDGDVDLSALKSEEGEECERDCVQFVCLRDYMSEDGEYLMGDLAHCVLAEVPRQFNEWFHKHNIALPHHD